eukprot:6487974-Amphidinium_carterae.1
MAPKKAGAKAGASTLTPAKRKVPETALDQVHEQSRSSIKGPQRRADLSISNAVRAAIRDNLRGWSKSLIWDKHSILGGLWAASECAGKTFAERIREMKEAVAAGRMK